MERSCSSFPDSQTVLSCSARLQIQECPAASIREGILTPAPSFDFPFFFDVLFKKIPEQLPAFGEYGTSLEAAESKIAKLHNKVLYPLPRRHR